MSARLSFEQSEIHGSQAVITLDRASRHNALVPDLLESVLDHIHAATVASPAGLLIESTGPSFSTGGDLREFWRHRDAIRSYADRLLGFLNEMIMALAGFPAPVACAVHGQVTGGSLGFLLASDHVVMHPYVTVRPWYSTVGFSPDGGWYALMPGRIGETATREWLDRDDTRDAVQCIELGLADTIDEAPGQAGRRWLATSPTVSRPDPEQLTRALELEKEAFVSRIGEDSALDGIRRFLQGELS